jgi:hypothetical protein
MYIHLNELIESNHRRRIAMSFHTSKTLVRALTPALAAALLHIGTAAAADYPTGDAQEQARAILRGVPSTLHPTVQSAVKTQGVRADAQESARRLLLGVTTPTSGQQQTDLPRATQNHVHGDAQVLAREVLLGRRDAVAAGS